MNSNMFKISGPFGNYERGTPGSIQYNSHTTPNRRQGMICDNCSMDISADMCFAI